MPDDYEVIWTGDKDGPHRGYLAVVPHAIVIPPRPVHIPGDCDSQALRTAALLITIFELRGSLTLRELLAVTGFTPARVGKGLHVLRDRHQLASRPEDQTAKGKGGRSRSVLVYSLIAVVG